MATITFKARIRTRYNVDDSPAYKYIEVPVLTRRHCDMHDFRNHSKYRALANSDLFPGILARIRANVLQNGVIHMDAIPPNVTIDDSGFLAVVTITAGV